MTIETLRGLLLWSGIINYGFLALWALLYLFVPGPLLRKIAGWYRVSPETFDAIQFSGILLYKMGIFFFNLIPYVALRIIA